MRNICSIEGCSSICGRHSAKGLCSKHYKRLQSTGTTDDGPKARAPIEIRFWKKVPKNKTTDECWLWMGGVTGKYGKVSVGKKNEGYVLAHRFSCELHHGPAPFENSHVMHTCDTPACVNPNHLKWGTASENIRDAFAKGRKVVAKGAQHPWSVLNEERVRFIRANIGMKSKIIAAMFGCTRGAIDGVKNRKSWNHIE